ncbi:MAG: hypothetical protein H0X25_23690 [Acidobacteriales bacterium]|nr:hypothetical protein [Terriglobales bacterium]
MDVALKVVALIVLLFLTQELLRRASKWVVWTLFLVVPVLLTPYWFRINDFGLFPWIKIYSVCVCVIWGTAVRHTSLGDRPWARLGIPLLLAANIIEATLLDLIEYGLAHSVNAAVGVLLIATMPYGAKDTRVDSQSRDLYYGTTGTWVCAYTLWNWTFVYLNYPTMTGLHTAVLASGLIVAAGNPQRWVQSRAYFLGLMLIVTATFNAELLRWMDTSNWSNERLGVAAAIASLALAIRCSVKAYSMQDESDRDILRMPQLSVA